MKLQKLSINILRFLFIGILLGGVISLTFLSVTSHIDNGIYSLSLTFITNILNKSLIITLICGLIFSVLLVDKLESIWIIRCTILTMVLFIILLLISNHLIVIFWELLMLKGYAYVTVKHRYAVNIFLFVISALIAILTTTIKWERLKLFRKQSEFNQKRKGYLPLKIFTAIGILIIVAINILNLVYKKSLRDKLKERPNICIISLDTLRADHLGVYGYFRDTTPNIDKWARRNIMFVNAFTTDTWTYPAHTSLLTGQHPSKLGIGEGEDYLVEDVINLPLILKNLGYKSATFFGGGWLPRLFERSSRNFPFDYKESTSARTNINAAEIMVKNALKWINQHEKDKFFLFAHTMQIHCPYNPPPEFDIFSDKNYQGHIKITQECYRVKKGDKKEDIDFLMAKYDGEIRFTDYWISKLIKKLESIPNTIIILLADHGESFWDHNRNVSHGTFYQEVMRIPLIMSIPNFNDAGMIVNQSVSLIDIMPTLLDLMGGEKIFYKQVQGISLLPLIHNPDRQFNRDIYCYSELHKLGVLLSKEYKLIYDLKNNRREFYNILQDPRETKNLADEFPEKVAVYEDKFRTWYSQQKGVAKKVGIDKELKKELKALGYLQ